jgi:hypothetical protein
MRDTCETNDSFILFCEPFWILVHSAAYAALIAPSFARHCHYWLTLFICQNLLSSVLTRLCEPLCMGRGCFTCLKDLFPISTRSSLANHSTRAGAPCSPGAVAAAGPQIRAGAEPEASEGPEFVLNLLRSLSSANTQCGATPRAPRLLLPVCRDRLTTLVVVLC